MIPSEAIESCRELLVALLEFADGDPALRRHAAHVYHCYLHALRASDDEPRRTLRWTRFIRALETHLALDVTAQRDASYLHAIVTENADLLRDDAKALNRFHRLDIGMRLQLANVGKKVRRVS